MTGKKPTPEGTVLLQLRRQSGWTQARLERTARLSRGMLSLYETGKRSIGRPLLERLAAALGHSKKDVDQALFAKVPAPEAPAALTPASLLPHEHQAVEAAAERAAARVRLGVGTRLIEARLRSDRHEAANLWSELRKLPTFRACRDRIDSDPRFRSWALCERLCDESVAAAARDVGIARSFAKLSLAVAQKTPGSDSWQCRVQGYAWTFVANSLRVSGDFRATDEAFRRGGALWGAGSDVGPAPLDRARLPSFLAAFRADQGRFNDARDLLSTAMQDTDWPAKRATLQLQLAYLLEHQGACEECLETLESTERLVAKAHHQPRLGLVLEASRSANLCGLGKFDEAQRVLVRVKRKAIELGNEIDALRVLWLSARVTAGLGRRSEAIALLVRVRQAFLQKHMERDANLADLELAKFQNERQR